MSKPSVGYKDIPLLWFKMFDLSNVVGFILPDWIADILVNILFTLKME